MRFKRGQYWKTTTGSIVEITAVMEVEVGPYTTQVFAYRFFDTKFAHNVFLRDSRNAPQWVQVEEVTETVTTWKEVES